ncbi:hypothetical protein VN1338_30050 [Helicobacter pylori]
MTTLDVPVRRLQQWNGAARLLRIVTPDKQEIRLGNGGEGSVSVSALGQSKLVVKSGFARSVWMGEVSPETRFVVGFRDPVSSIRHRSTIVILDESSGQLGRPGATGSAVFVLQLLSAFLLLLALRFFLDHAVAAAVVTLGLALTTLITAGFAAKSVDP